jgi:phenylacetate-CoA ligase
MYSLALLIKEANLKVSKLRCAISNAEPLLQHQIDIITEIFGCTVVNTYGMSELVAAACSFNDVNEMLIWPEVGLIETLQLESDLPVLEGESGRLICTSLLNKDMPLIRYEVGDTGIITDSSAGIKFQKITELTGRIDDLVITDSGKRIGRLDPVFKNNFNIKEAQIIQETLSSFTLKVVPDSDYNDKNGEAMVNSLKERVGEIRVNIELCESIERTNTGKFKAVISKVKHEQ